MKHAAKVGTFGIGICVVASVAAAMLSPFAVRQPGHAYTLWRWEYPRLEAALSAFSALASVLMALTLVTASRSRQQAERDFFPALGLFGMGLLIAFQSVADLGKGLLLLHTAAAVVGGVGFALVWAPRAAARRGP
ncbi:MAG TPA: hypothetical protein PKL84_17720, partial [Candidatus Hydrogenedentes bacterium]|nr:hypothetical protein [Candidatus Hydrogenedentota bacterium]